MAGIVDILDLDGLRLGSGEGRRLDLEVGLGEFDLGGERYVAEPPEVPARLDVSRTVNRGYSLRLRFAAGLAGPCMRCLTPAAPTFEIDAREVSQPGDGEELESPYLADGELRVADWAHDALALVLPSQILCRADCVGLCPVCGVALADAGEDHHHDAAPDPRWAKLSELRFE